MYAGEGGGVLRPTTFLSFRMTVYADFLCSAFFPRVPRVGVSIQAPRDLSVSN